MKFPQQLTLRHYGLLLATTLLLLFLLVITRPQKSAELRPPVVPSVVVTQVVQGDVAPTLQVRGRLQPRLAATLSAEVAGVVVERVAEPGQRVEAGDLLLRLDEGDYRDALVRAGAQLEQERAAVARDRKLLALAQQNSKLQRREVERQQRLGSESLSSVSRLEEARQKLLQLEAEEARLDYAVGTAASRLALRRAEVERAERDLARCRLSAPFAGTVNELLADVGDRIAVNRQLASLVALDEMDFYAELPGGVQSGLLLGQTLAITLNGERREGRLLALQRQPDPKTHTLALRIRVAGEGLLPGALAEAELPLRPLHDVLKVPVAALLREDGRAYLFVEKDGVLTRREVQTGARDGETVVVAGGVSAGERIVARDVAALSDGQQVKPLGQ